MERLSVKVGQKIRQYRQAKKMTLEELASKIYKNKSTVSKYETGEIAIDLDTLFDISKAINIPITSLIPTTDTVKDKGEIITNNDFEKAYIYMFDGRTNKILRGLIEHYDYKESNSSKATLFYNIQSFDEPGKCKALYTGEVIRHEFVINYSFENQTNKIEKVFLCFLNTLEYSDIRTGLLSGLSARTLLPISMKCVISRHKLKEDNELIEVLKLSKEDIRLTKRFNMFTIDQLN